MNGTPNQLLGNLTPETFLTDYWQKKPLLIRNAIPDFISPIDPDELAGLACEDEVESRLILERDGSHPWALEHGPFAEQRFADLPESHWTLLVQECNKYVPELAALMERFDFIPNWRGDDVMVSYAPDQGTVGPHTDQYDVFLLQGLGTRRWQISTDPVENSSGEKTQLPDLELSILKEFTPTEEWVLEPGDMLYLPPGLAHYGVAMENCITISVGFRAPSHTDIITGLFDSVVSKLDNECRYTDPDLALQQHPGEISGESLLKVRDIFHTFANKMMSDITVNSTAISSWFGRFVTESKSGETASEPEQVLEPEQFLSQFREHGMIERNEMTRFAYANHDDTNILFVDGQEYPLSNELSFIAPLLCDQRQHSYPELADNLAQSNFTSFLTELYNAGYLTFMKNQDAPHEKQNDFQVDRVTWNDAEDDLRMLRELIFIREQNVPPELEWDGKDEDCVHLLARDNKDRPIGTSRMTADGHIGRMAVLRAWRNRGVGNTMLTALTTIARARQLPRVQLDAQIQAIDFYLRHNFEVQGEEFMDAGIPHKHMVRTLPSLNEGLNIIDLQQQILGETRDLIRLESRDDNRLAANRMVEQAQFSLRLFTPNLDPRIFDTNEFIEAVKNLALISTHSKIYILILDPTVAVTRGHRIVELARKVSSHIFINRADEEDQKKIGSLMIVDDVGIIRRPHADRYEGSVEFNNPGEARLLTKEFKDSWERSTPEPELRRLHL